MMPTMLLNDKEIRQLAEEERMIQPFEPNQVKGQGTISYGLSSFGYDIRCESKFEIFNNLNPGIVDPKNLSRDLLKSVDVGLQPGAHVTIPPNSFALCHSF